MKTRFLILFLFWMTKIYALEIQVLSHYDYEPWVISEQKKDGLLFDLVSQLNESFKGKHSFRLQILPRKRLDKQLQGGDKIIVPFVDPRFFNDKEMKKYEWSQVIINDASYLVSHIDNKVEFDSISSLNGKRFSATSGHIYKEFDESIKNGKIKRFNSNSYLGSLKMLIRKRDVDFGVIDDSFIYYMTNNTKNIIDFSKLHKSRKIRTIIERRILLSKDLNVLKDDFEKVIKDIQKSDSWKNKLLFVWNSN